MLLKFICLILTVSYGFLSVPLNTKVEENKKPPMRRQRLPSSCSSSSSSVSCSSSSSSSSCSSSSTSRYCRRPRQPSSSSSSSSSSTFCYKPPVCNKNQLQQSAISLALQYQVMLSNCQFSNITANALPKASALVTQHGCPNPARCCNDQFTLPQFFVDMFGECAFHALWINQQPLSAVLGPNGRVSVFAVEQDVPYDEAFQIRTYQVELVFAPSSYGPVYGDWVANYCNLKLEAVRYRFIDCPASTDVPLCTNCGSSAPP